MSELRISKPCLGDSASDDSVVDEDKGVKLVHGPLDWGSGQQIYLPTLFTCTLDLWLCYMPNAYVLTQVRVQFCNILYVSCHSFRHSPRLDPTGDYRVIVAAAEIVVRLRSNVAQGP